MRNYSIINRVKKLKITRFIRKALKNAFPHIKLNKATVPEIDDAIVGKVHPTSIINDINKLCSSQVLKILWVIPPLGVGSGGHINIFRFVKMLDAKGQQNAVWVIGKNNTSDSTYHEFVFKHYGYQLSERVEFIESKDPKSVQDAHIGICTSWITAYYLRLCEKSLIKAYFVQDFEPFFYPKGSRYYFSENTYKMGFVGITAGDWLSSKLKEDYGMICYPLGFSYDKELYFSRCNREKLNRVTFYVRPSTERRCFELSIACARLIHERNNSIEVAFIGTTFPRNYLPSYIKDYGQKELIELAEVYQSSMIVVVFSATNVSLLPLEVMACNTAVLSNIEDSNRWILNNENSILVQSDPVIISRKILDLFRNKEGINEIASSGNKFALATSWEAEGEKLNRYLEKLVKNKLKNLEYNSDIICRHNEKFHASGEVAVIIHLYYPEMWEEIERYLSNIKCSFDIYISINYRLDTNLLERIMSLNSKIYLLENRGRDIAPFVKIFCANEFDRYLAVCKIHSKKSSHISKEEKFIFDSGDDWRSAIYDGLLGSPGKVSEIIDYYNKNPKIGIVGLSSTLVLPGSKWFHDAGYNHKEIAADSGLDQYLYNGFFAGSMFWFRPKSLYKLRTLGIESSMFEDEGHQVSGTLAHSLERLFNAISESSGYINIALD